MTRRALAELVGACFFAWGSFFALPCLGKPEGNFAHPATIGKPTDPNGLGNPISLKLCFALRGFAVDRLLTVATGGFVSRCGRCHQQASIRAGPKPNTRFLVRQ